MTNVWWCVAGNDRKGINQIFLPCRAREFGLWPGVLGTDEQLTVALYCLVGFLCRANDFEHLVVSPRPFTFRSKRDRYDEVVGVVLAILEQCTPESLEGQWVVMEFCEVDSRSYDVVTVGQEGDRAMVYTRSVRGKVLRRRSLECTFIG